MFDDSNRLALTAKDIELIESALHTQKKILSVQSDAGAASARDRLAEVNHLMKRVARAAPCPQGHAPKGQGLAYHLRAIFGTGGGCQQAR
jgi:hypothetical protein